MFKFLKKENVGLVLAEEYLLLSSALQFYFPLLY